MDAALIPALHDALVVAQTGSVGEAARRLGKTTSAVSQQLRRIEAQLGVALFEKQGRGVRLSPAGEVALGSLTRLFDEAASLGGLLEELGSAGRVTTLRVAASDYLGEALLLPVLRGLFEGGGVSLRFEITTTNSVEAARLVVDGQADVAIVSTDRAAGPDETTIGRQRFHWVAPRLPRAKPQAAKPQATKPQAAKPQATKPQAIRARLAHEPLLRLGPGSRGRRALDELLGRLRLRPVSTIDVRSVSLLLAYVRQGLGIGLVPDLALRKDDRARLAVEDADLPALDVRLLCRPSLKRTRPVARFLDGLAAEARRMAK
jgi:DNA-binding transcriptional LysR family regulator